MVEKDIDMGRAVLTAAVDPEEELYLISHA